MKLPRIDEVSVRVVDTESFVETIEGYYGSRLPQHLTREMEHCINSFLRTQSFQGKSEVKVEVTGTGVSLLTNQSTLGFLKEIFKYSDIVDPQGKQTAWHVDDSGHRVFVDSLVIQYNNTADILISEHHFKRSLVNCVTKEFDSYSKAMRYLSRNPDLPKRQQELWEQAGNHKPFVAYLANPDDNVIFSVNILPAGIKISLSTYKFHDNKITKEKQSVSSEYLKRYSDVIYITLADAVRGLLAGRKSALEKEESCWDSYIKAFENGV